MPYSHASMFLLVERSEATKPYNKYEPLQINQVPCILAVTALILSRFENRLFCLVLKPAVSRVDPLTSIFTFIPIVDSHKQTADHLLCR